MANPKIGILGIAGSIGSRHAKNFEELGCEVIGYDPVQDGEDNEFGDKKRSLIKGADAVVICSPTPNHFHHIANCHSENKPCFVEKPIGMHRYELEHLPKLSNVLMVGYNLRFHSCVRKVREWLGQGLIGKPMWARFIVAQYSDRPHYLRDGVVLNWSHEIDLALYLLGEAILVGSAISRDPENLAEIILTHPLTRCTSTVHLDYLTEPERRGFAIIGEYGSIDADLITRQAFLKDRDGKLIHCHFGRDSYDGNYLHEAMSFLAMVKGQVEPKHLVGCSAKEAMAVMDICLTAKEKNLYEQA